MSAFPTVVRRALLCVALAAVSAAAGAAPRTLTYTDVLKELTDLDRLTRLQLDVKAGLFSSWDRAGREVWGANGDAGQYLRVEPDGEAVMMDIDGPGCVYRLWSANPQGRIRVYLDGDTKPTYEWDHASLYTGTIPPFIKPLVYQRDGAQSASDCYLPIPFSRHIKVTADKKLGQYYQLNYLLFPKDWQVSSFRLPLSGDEQTALAAAADAWAHPGRDPKPQMPGQQTITRTLTLKPHQTINLANLKGPGEVRAIRATVTSDQRYYWRKVVLRGTWDGAAFPQLLTPLGPLFGFDWQTAEYGSLIAGCQKGQCYFYYPMPFRRSGKLELISHLEKPAEVKLEIDWAPVRSLPDDSLYFYARWRHEPDSMTFDYPFVETAGKGHFVGVAMPIDHPLGGWWGEGDDKVWVDDDQFPPWIGTGSEDYFGDAWGIRYLPGPSWGCSEMTDHRTCNYRWHFMDNVPFSERFRMTIENYGPNGAGPRGQYDYSSTAFWYQAEVTPPFEKLEGMTYIGGESPTQKPSTYTYHPHLFSDLDDQAVRTYGLALTFASQAEDLFPDAVKSRKARLVTDALRPYEFDRERALDFGRVRDGQVLAEGSLNSAAAGAYLPRLYTAPDPAIVPLALEVDGQRLAVADASKRPLLALDGLYLKAGDHKLRLIAAGDGQALLDCLQMQPVPREEGAMEAEDMTVVRTLGGAPAPQAGRVVMDASAGRLLEWRPTAADQGVVLRLAEKPRLPYVLGVRAVRGPSSGIVQAFASGKPIGPAFDLYSAQRGRAAEILPLGPVSADTGEIELRVVGKNPQSGGYNVDLDYFRFEPKVLGPGTDEGVGARILGVRDGGYRIQDLAGDYVGGHQLWVQPSGPNALLTIELTVPREADYRLRVRYTTSWDYAIVQALVDGKPLGPAFDCYTAAVERHDELDLGVVHLTAGAHALQFQAAGKNPKSAGYLMGIDYVAVKAE